MAQEFLQVSKINITETIISIVKRKLLQIYLTICALLGLLIHQVNIMGISLKSLLDNNKYPIDMKLLLGIEQM